jgi:hypothetical protein
LSLENKPLLNQLPGESRNPAAGLVALLDAHHSLKTNKLLPAQVVEYNRTTNIATVQPMMMVVDTNENTHERNQIAACPVLSLGGGGFTINFPLQKNSLGWILAADRDISTFLETYAPAPPNTTRKHRFEDSWFIPDVFRNYVINSSDANAMVITSVDGTTRISISEGYVNIFAPSGATVTTPLATFTQAVNIEGALTVTGLATINGGMNASASESSNVTLPANTTINGITVATHGHDGVQSGSSRTSAGMVS